MTVHFPIAFYLLGLGLTGAYLWRGQAEYDRFAYWSFILSWLTALVSSLTGLIDQNQLTLDDPRRATVDTHITGSMMFLILNGLLLYMRFRWPTVLTDYRWPYLGLMGGGAIALMVTGWWGGELVYTLGVGVK